MRVFGVDQKFIEQLETPWEVKSCIGSQTWISSEHVSMIEPWSQARDYLIDLCEDEDLEIPFLQLFHLHEVTCCNLGHCTDAQF